MVRGKGLEPSRLCWDTGTSSLPVYRFQHPRVCSRVGWLPGTQMLLYQIAGICQPLFFGFPCGEVWRSRSQISRARVTAMAAAPQAMDWGLSRNQRMVR